MGPAAKRRARSGVAKSQKSERPPAPPTRLFVLDTNVLLHDPTAIFRFEEHDIFLPMIVLEELDANKKGLSEASRSARQV
ncbi:MAG TPA: PIN domain-containing protein, partial [Steroidobacteraceae bacterium]|nr:PIN domain-containing protein [Steroidobacteraceae bacterium]